MQKLLILTILFILFQSSSPARADYETGGVVKMTLSNGVTLLVRPEPESRVAAVEVFVRVGAQDENESTTGIGQVLAGSILSGSTTYSTRRLAKLVAEAGGNFHSVWQWNYIEVYAVTLPSGCEEAISLLADSIQNSSLDPQAIEYSRSTILKEMRRQEDDPFISAYTALRTALYRGTAYGRAYLGDAQDIGSITAKQVRDFYQHNITPDRIVVSVVGNVSPDAVAAKVEVCFKNMDLSYPKTHSVSAPAAAKQEITLRKAGSTTYVMQGFPAPGVEDKDYLPMCVANVLLGGNKSSLLFTSLREQQGYGYLVGSQYPALAGASILVAYLGMDANRATPETVKTVEDIMANQVKILREGGFSDKDLDRAKRYLIGKHSLDHERTRDRAYRFGLAEAMGLGYQSDIHVVYADEVNKVTREDVLRACKKYLAEATTLAYLGK